MDINISIFGYLILLNYLNDKELMYIKEKERLLLKIYSKTKVEKINFRKKISLLKYKNLLEQIKLINIYIRKVNVLRTIIEVRIGYKKQKVNISKSQLLRNLYQEYIVCIKEEKIVKQNPNHILNLTKPKLSLANYLIKYNMTKLIISAPIDILNKLLIFKENNRKKCCKVECILN